MSRIGRKPIVVPAGVQVAVSGRTVTVETVRTLIERHGAEASAWLPHFITPDQEEQFP